MATRSPTAGVSRGPVKLILRWQESLEWLLEAVFRGGPGDLGPHPPGPDGAVRVMLWGACCLVLTVVVAFGLLREDRYVLAIGAVGWALAAAQFAGPGWRR